MAKIKPAKPGFWAASKPGFWGLKIGGLPGFSGTRDWNPYYTHTRMPQSKKKHNH